jgi:hypothetical protein
MKRSLSAIALATLLGACVAAPSGPISPATPSPVPSTAASAPLASSTPVPTAVPTSTPAPSEAVDWQAGQPLTQYDFEGLHGVYYNPYLDQLNVIDAVNDDVTVPRYLLRKFRADGSYMSTVELAPADEDAPDAVDAMTFDPSGAPLFSYRDDGEFRLMKLFTSTVLRAEGYPLNGAAWGGPSALRANGANLSVALLNLDVDDRDDARRRGVTPVMTGGSLNIGVAEEDEQPSALFQVADPFVPTRALAFSPAGDLFVGGQAAGGGFGLKRIKLDQSIEDLGQLPARPEGMWTRPAGGVYLAWEPGGSAAARLLAADAAGKLGAEQELRLSAGGFLTEIEGIAFDKQGRAIVAGSGFDATNQRISGIYVFAKRP